VFLISAPVGGEAEKVEALADADRAGLATSVRDGAVVHVLPSVAGG
jgi:molybdopterin converting factor small subunit